MNNLPRFVARPRPDPEPFDMADLPTCYCGSTAALDVATGVCKTCFRVLVMCRLALAMGGLDTGTPVVDDELEGRRLPRLSDEGGNGGVALDVGLETPQPKRTR